MSWLEQGQTLERANARMQKSIALTNYISEIPCIWADDLIAEFIQTHGPHKRTAASIINDRPCNSFFQYRMLAQHCFFGRQTDISKGVEVLWRAESKEMYFYCFRNSEIEARNSSR